MDNLKKGFILIVILMFSVFSGFAQDKNTDKVEITSSEYRPENQINKDKDECYSDTESQFDRTKHKTLKNTGAGAAAGGIVGGILGHGGVGAAAGGAAGAYRGHKKSQNDKNEFNELYASCLRDKGYSVEVND